MAWPLSQDSAEREAAAAPPAARPGVLRRVYYWYSLAAADLTAEGQTRAEKRLAEPLRELPDRLAPWEHLDLSNAKPGSGVVRLQPGRPLAAKQASRGRWRSRPWSAVPGARSALNRSRART
jgi:hypothetical protein